MRTSSELCILDLTTQSAKVRSNGISGGQDQSVSLQLFNTVKMFDNLIFCNIERSS